MPVALILAQASADEPSTLLIELAGMASYFLHPSTLILLACGLGLCLSLFHRGSKIGRRLMMVGSAGLLLVSLPLGDWPLSILENRFPDPDALPDHVDGIVTIGGAIDLGISDERRQPTTKIGSDRMTTFVALARQYPDAKLVFAGGGGGDPDDLQEADVAQYLFGSLGLDDSRVIYDRASRNTRENALFARDLVQPKPSETWLLVTSAADIPRAVGSFRAVGWPVAPWPVDYLVGREPNWMPHPVGGLRNLDWATHEWLGLIYYHLQGWTDAWFPAPNRSALSEATAQTRGAAAP